MKKNGGRGHLPVYGSYVFRSKDPAIDNLRTVIEDHFGARVNGAMLKQMHEDGGPSIAAMRNWFFGPTMRPTNPALEAAGRSMGFQRAWQKMPTYEPWKGDVPKARVVVRSKKKSRAA